ncbi:caspase family protein [Methylobacterium sp. 17Sr1-1]|uniref:caspase family protein n=1 Tax=Methylobacterium sp. 17Sr1-1 TaxID=2202826 RepID=UPI000D6EC472|nr:caspase family protein [Methylobacterium sp. 17Sr1-1]AWN52162.1 hypothetical protein DK412_11170 [Methylobacterium sp. 17Sr1-1]
MRNDLGLIFDENHIDRPGLHAILIGVSSYPYLNGSDHAADETYGLGQLASPALTVVELADVLLKQAASMRPALKTLRLLASPSSDEPIGQQGTAFKNLPAAHLKNVMRAIFDWRNDASFRMDDATLFYFAGHGIQRTGGDVVLLLEDFLQNVGAVLGNTVDVMNLRDFMANESAPQIARKQLYVIDACRSTVGKLRKYIVAPAAGLFDVEAPVDGRTAPILYAAGAGEKTYGAPGQISVFGKDFKACLEGRAGERLVEGTSSSWVLTMNELVRVISSNVQDFNKAAGAKLRSLEVDKFNAAERTEIRGLNGPPLVSCQFHVNPEAAHKITAPILRRPNNAAAPGFPAPPIQYPYACDLPAGSYLISAVVTDMNQNPKFAHVEEIVEIRPPSFNYTLEMSR